MLLKPYPGILQSNRSILLIMLYKHSFKHANPLYFRLPECKQQLLPQNLQSMVLRDL